MSLPLALRDDLFIDGAWRPASSAAHFDVVDPASEQILAQVASATPADALDAVTAAAAAQPEWAVAPSRQRAEVLRRAFELMTSRADAFAELIVAESGKSTADARGEVVYAAEFLRWFSEEAAHLSGSLGRAPSGSHRLLVTHEPVGVALLITPWNFPAAMITRKVAPALAAGCTVVIKPAEETPLTALLLADVLAEAGAPPGVVNVVPTDDPAPLVAAALADRRVRKLSFTGSTAVGRRLLEGASASITNCSMELGGNAPFIVCADADLDRAVADALVAKMRNSGQACTAANRFLVHRSVAQEFADRFAVALTRLSVGPGRVESNAVGPLITDDARRRVADLVAEAVDSGATARPGAEAPGTGWFLTPTLLVDVPADARVVREEIFGPVAPVVTFDDEADAVAMANDTDAGLVAYVESGDLRHGLAIAERLEFGMVGVNRGLVSDPAAPFGGMKQSGLGREGAHDGLLEYCETKYIAAEW